MLDNTTKQLDSPLGGEVSLTVTSGTRARVSFKDVKVFGKEWSGSFHLHKAGGVWALWNHCRDGNQTAVTPYEQRYQCLYVSSVWNGKKHVEATSASREKILEKLTPVAVAELAANTRLVHAAEVEHLGRKIEIAQAHLAKLAEEAAQEELHLASLRAELASLEAA